MGTIILVIVLMGFAYGLLIIGKVLLVFLKAIAVFCTMILLGLIILVIIIASIKAII